MLDALNLDRSRIDRAEIEQAFDEGRLAGSIDSGEADAALGWQIEVDPPKNFGVPKALAHSTESNQCFGHQMALCGMSR